MMPKSFSVWATGNLRTPIRAAQKASKQRDKPIPKRPNRPDKLNKPNRPDRLRKLKKLVYLCLIGQLFMDDPCFSPDENAFPSLILKEDS
jgi:hypothetical protein